MPETTTFSTALRERSSASHSQSEHSGFMADLLKGDGTREDYAALVAQHFFIYEALEAAVDRVKDDPIAAPFLRDELTRLPALEADLAFLLGPDWREQISPLPSTREYVDRINGVGDWAGGLVAHHYTRYLGDLSGGLFIGKVMARRFGFEDEGVSFYVFDRIPDPAAFKDEYREQLDAAPWDEVERERVIDEVLQAYAYNTALFHDLDRARSAA